VDFGGEGQSQLLGGRTGAADIFVVEVTVQGGLAGFGVDLAIVLQLDPGLGGLV